MFLVYLYVFKDQKQYFLPALLLTKIMQIEGRGMLIGNKNLRLLTGSEMNLSSLGCLCYNVSF